MQSGTILIISRSADDWASAQKALVEQYGYRTLLYASLSEASAALASVHVDVVIAEDRAGDAAALEALTVLRVSHPEVIRVYLTEGILPEFRTRLMQAAVYQFLFLPLDMMQLSLVLKRGLETRELARRHRLLSREFKFTDDTFLSNARRSGFKAESQRFEKIVYVSERMAELCNTARQAAKTELPVLIQGETGTGKELLAKAIHYNSSRKTSPLLVQNCGGMPDELLQSELFGHKRGAFTGAVADRLGLFRAADKGTVFLDEISEVSPSFQVSLLRFLQEGEVKPLGSDKVSYCNVRIIAASNRPLEKLVQQGEFRQDLYFRLKGFEIVVPSLRDRPEDIGPLTEFFAAKHADALGRKVLGISANAIEKFSNYDFPGNVRELENEVRRMVALAADGEYVTTRHMSPAILTAHSSRAARVPSVIIPTTSKNLKDQVEELERQLVKSALQRHRWNQSRAADELGLSRVGLANKVKRYSLDSEQTEAGSSAAGGRQ